MKKIFTGLVLAALAITLTGCKPTEKNYKAAYDAAKAKREAAKNDKDIPGMALIKNDSEPQPRQVGEATVLVRTERLFSDGEEGRQPAPFNVVVGQYKMSSNARAHAESLREEGYDAYVLKNSNNTWFAAVAPLETLEEAPEVIAKFIEKHPDMIFPGLPDAPVVEIMPSR